MNHISYEEETELEYMYCRDEDQSGKQLRDWFSAINLAVSTWDRHSVRTQFPIYKIGVSNLNLKDFEEPDFDKEKLEKLLKTNNIKLEFIPVPIEHFIINGRR